MHFIPNSWRQDRVAVMAGWWYTRRRWYWSAILCSFLYTAEHITLPLRYSDFLADLNAKCFQENTLFIHVGQFSSLQAMFSYRLGLVEIQWFSQGHFSLQGNKSVSLDNQRNISLHLILPK